MEQSQETNCARPAFVVALRVQKRQLRADHYPRGNSHPAPDDLPCSFSRLGGCALPRLSRTGSSLSPLSSALFSENCIRRTRCHAPIGFASPSPSSVHNDPLRLLSASSALLVLGTLWRIHLVRVLPSVLRFSRARAWEPWHAYAYLRRVCRPWTCSRAVRRPFACHDRTARLLSFQRGKQCLIPPST